MWTKYNTENYNTTQCMWVQYNTVRYNKIQYNKVQYSTKEFSRVQYDTNPIPKKFECAETQTNTDLKAA